MSNEKKLRLLQVAKEFKVGIATITDFLAKKGVHIESSPNTLVEPDVYAVLAKEFGGNRSANERVNVRERINLKPESVSLHDKKDSPRAHDSEFEEEVVIKSGVISARDEIRTGPKIVGKIDLSGGNRKPAAPQPAAAKKEEPKGSPVRLAKQCQTRTLPCSPAENSGGQQGERFRKTGCITAPTGGTDGRNTACRRTRRPETGDRHCDGSQTGNRHTGEDLRPAHGREPRQRLPSE